MLPEPSPSAPTALITISAMKLSLKRSIARRIRQSGRDETETSSGDPNGAFPVAAMPPTVIPCWISAFRMSRAADSAG